MRSKYFIATAISYSQDISLAQANFIEKSTRRSKCFFLTPQTVIPLTGKMSQSDKRVIAKNEQLEPVIGQKYCRATVLEADVALCISSCSPHPFFCHRQRGTVSQLTAAVRLLWVMAQVRVHFKVKQKRPLRERSFSFGASNSYSPDRGNVTQWQKGDCEVRATRTCGRCYGTVVIYFK